MESRLFAFMLAVNSGMRGAEIKKLRLRHVDLDNRRLTIEAAKNLARKPHRGVKPERLFCGNKSVGSSTATRGIRTEPPVSSRFVTPCENNDSLKSERGFDVERHPESWSTAWKKSAGCFCCCGRTKGQKRKPGTYACRTQGRGGTEQDRVPLHAADVHLLGWRNGMFPCPSRWRWPAT